MGENNLTHDDEQRIVEHDCGRTVRLNTSDMFPDDRDTWCGKCNETFSVER